MKDILTYQNYKEYVRDWVLKQPNQGRGIYRLLAQKLQISTTMISQIFNGDKHLGIDHCLRISEVLGFSDFQQEYFLNLLLRDKAAHHKNKEVFERKLAQLRKNHAKVQEIIVYKDVLTEQQKSIYYSNWIYGAIRSMLNIPEYRNPSKLAQKLNVDLTQIEHALKFLSECDLIDRSQMTLKQKSIHLDKDSYLTKMRQQTWRLKSINTMLNDTNSEHMFFNSLVTISKNDVEKVKSVLRDAIKQSQEVVLDSSDVEDLYCLNIDFFRV